MDFLEYVKSHSCCAINNIPEDVVFVEFAYRYPNVFIPEQIPQWSFHEHGKNMRFVRGRFVSFCSTPYGVNDMFGCDAVISWDDLDLDMLIEETKQCDISALL